MKKYIQLYATYKTPKGAIWEHSSGEIYFNKETQLLEDEYTLINNPYWFAVLEKTYAKNWEDLDKISGYYIDGDCDVMKFHGGETERTNMDVYATQNQARAALAESQLSQLLKEIYDSEGWKPVFNGVLTVFCITLHEGVPRVTPWYRNANFLAFPTKKLAEEFLENHRELIYIYFSKYNW